MAERVRFELGGGLAVEWGLGALMRAADARDPAAEPVWELEGEPDWQTLESLRLIAGAAGETALALAVARPAGAADHSGDGIAMALVGPDGAEGADEALLSTEYGPDGRLRRLGVEAWLEGGTGERIAADRSGDDTTSKAGGLRRVVTPLVLRMGGREGGALHELLGPG